MNLSSAFSANLDKTYGPVHNMYYTEVKAMPTQKPRYTIIVDEELLQRIDDFRFENRYPNRSAATIELIRLGLEAIEKKKKDKPCENESE